MKKINKKKKTSSKNHIPSSVDFAILGLTEAIALLAFNRDGFETQSKGKHSPDCIAHNVLELAFEKIAEGE